MLIILITDPEVWKQNKKNVEITDEFVVAFIFKK